MIVGRILSKPAFKHIPCHVLGEQRIFGIGQHDSVFIVTEDGICRCAELYGISEREGILRILSALVHCCRCCTECFSCRCFLCKLQSSFRFLRFIFGKKRLFLFSQVSVNGNQLTKPSRYGFPSYGVLFFVVIIGEVNPLAVMVYKAAFPIQVGVRVAADAIFLFEKCNSRI